MLIILSDYSQDVRYPLRTVEKLFYCSSSSMFNNRVRFNEGGQ